MALHKVAVVEGEQVLAEYYRSKKIYLGSFQAGRKGALLENTKCI